jgi:hypothetical protein
LISYIVSVRAFGVSFFQKTNKFVSYIRSYYFYYIKKKVKLF